MTQHSWRRLLFDNNTVYKRVLSLGIKAVRQKWGALKRIAIRIIFIKMVWQSNWKDKPMFGQNYDLFFYVLFIKYCEFEQHKVCREKILCSTKLYMKIIELRRRIEKNESHAIKQRSGEWRRSPFIQCPFQFNRLEKMLSQEKDIVRGGVWREFEGICPCAQYLLIYISESLRNQKNNKSPKFEYGFYFSVIINLLLSFTEFTAFALFLSTLFVLYSNNNH